MFKVSATCECPGDRYLPIRLSEGAVAMLDKHDPDHLLLSYRCNDCQQIIEVKFHHLPSGVARAV